MQTWVRFPERFGENRRRPMSAVIDQPKDNKTDQKMDQKDMSLDDLPTGIALRPAEEAKGAVSSHRPAPASYPDKITRAEELRLQLADENRARRPAAGGSP